MIRLMTGLVIWLTLSVPAFAASEVIEVFYLPMQEAAEAAKSQLSSKGKVAVISSRRMLVLEDDSTHIKQAKALLKQLDQPVQQFLAQVELQDIRSDKGSSAGLSSANISTGQLPGGWARIQLDDHSNISSNRSSFQLRISANEPGNIEIGTLQTLNRETRLWLSGYGLVQMNSVELIPITSGFKVQVWPVGLDKVRVRITPWMQRSVNQVSGRHEMLVDLGTAQNPNTPPSNAANMRYNAVPHIRKTDIVELTGAATELTVPLNETVTIAASQNEARKLGSALLSRHSTIGKRNIVIRLRISR